MRRLIPILLGLAILGTVTGIAVIMLLFLGQDWERRPVLDLRGGDDRLGAAGRDDARHHPLRAGDDRLLRVAGRDLRDHRRAAARRRAGHRLHRRDQRPDPVRDHADPDQGRPEPAGLPDAGGPGGDRLDRHRDRHRAGHRRDRLGRGGEAVRPSPPRRCRTSCSTDFVLPFEIVSVLLLAAVIGGVFLAKREPGGPS